MAGYCEQEMCTVCGNNPVQIENLEGKQMCGPCYEQSEVRKSTRKMQVTMAAASPEEVQAMYNFFNLLELLYDCKYGSNDSTPDDMEDAFPDEWVKEAERLYCENDKNQLLPDDWWKSELIKFAFSYYTISAGWRRVIGGFESLFKTFCVKDHDTLTYDTDHLVQLIEQAENCTITKKPNNTIDEQKD